MDGQEGAIDNCADRRKDRSPLLENETVDDQKTTHLRSNETAMRLDERLSPTVHYLPATTMSGGKNGACRNEIVPYIPQLFAFKNILTLRVIVKWFRHLLFTSIACARAK
jgi:hypothetical protein